MSQIARLPDTLINQIAAGEMIERPASIIKELCENAMDAGATRIDVDFDGGGRDKIVVADNGCGIAPEDLPLALERHATSKIRVFDDLMNVSSLGFRGEALASIASAAHLEINSATLDGEPSALIRAEGGRISAVERAHRTVGTTITVRDLFFSIPARRQFLKSVATEAGHCVETCRRLALVRPNIAWRVRHNGRVVFEVPTDDDAPPIARWQNILGEAFFTHYRLINETLADGHIDGILALPSSATMSASRECQYILLNGRPIRDKTVAHALREGYAEMKHDARRLSFALWLDWPREQVDVNVSPMKTEVRWRQSQAVYSAVYHSVRKALALRVQGAMESGTTPIMPLFSSAINPATTGLAPASSHSSHHSSPTTALFSPQRADAQPATARTLPSINTRAYDIRDSAPISAPTAYTSPNPAVLNPGDEAMPPLGIAIGMVHNLYILAQNAEGLVIVDIHAAHERLLFEQLRQSCDQSRVLSQTLLVPWKIALDEHDINLFTAHENDFARWGVKARLDNSANKDGGTLIIDAVPALLANADYPALVRAMLDDLAQFGQSQVLAQESEQVLATMACHGARRGRQQMSLAEMNALLREMEQWERSGSCNHGRPSYSVVPLSAFDSFFMRGQ